MGDDYRPDDDYDTEDDLYDDPLYDDEEYEDGPPKGTDQPEEDDDFSPFPTAFYGFVAMIMGEEYRDS